MPRRRVSEVVDFIRKYIGEAGAKVFEVLVNTDKELLDSDIIKKTDLNEQDLRRALYELHNLGLVTYKKARSPEDNRFIYYWRVDSTRLNYVLLQRKKQVLKRLKERLEMEESNTFYVCPVDGIRVSFEEAMEHDFKCPRCGEMLVFEDNSEVKERLRKLISRLEEEISNEEKLLTS